MNIFAILYICIYLSMHIYNIRINIYNIISYECSYLISMHLYVCIRLFM